MTRHDGTVADRSNRQGEPVGRLWRGAATDLGKATGVDLVAYYLDPGDGRHATGHGQNATATNRCGIAPATSRRSG